MELEKLLELSITDKDKLSYWLELLPFMDYKHKVRLRQILEKEQEELAKLEKKFAWPKNDKSKKEIYEEIFVNV